MYVNITSHPLWPRPCLLRGVASIGEMSEAKLHAPLEAQQLMDCTASEVVDAVNVGDEITVRFRAMF
jgi:hypothetical protein